MTFKFNRAFDKIATKIATPKSEHELFLERVDLIKNKILQKMDEINSFFKGMFVNLEETAYYEKGSSYIDLPINFDMYLKLKMPFNIVPYFRSTRYRTVQLRTKVNHPIVDDGVIKPHLVKLVMGRELMRAISSMGHITCNDGAVFKLYYEEEPEWDGHTITANENTELEADDNKIIFSFMPAIMIATDDYWPLPSWISHSQNKKYWFSIPFSGHGERNHYGIDLKWQTTKRSDKIKAKNLILMLQKVLPQIFDSYFILATIRFYFISMLDQENNEFVLNNPLGDLFMDVLSLIGAFIGNNIFEACAVPSLEALSALIVFKDRINRIHWKFHEFQSGRKKFKANDIKALFGI